MSRTRGLFFVCLFGCLLIANVMGASGDVDTTFNASLANVPSGRVITMAQQSDGKLIVAGEIGTINGITRTLLARLNTDGSLDTSFIPPVVTNSGPGYAISSVAIQSTGKILIGGQLGSINGVSQPRLARLNYDGTPDTAFNSSPALAGLWLVNHVEVYGDDRIIFGGAKIFGGISIRDVVIRLNADGSLNKEVMDASAFDFLLLPDGKILTAGGNGISRFNDDLSTDNSFQTIGLGGKMARQSDGKIIIAGNFVSYNGFPVGRVARLNVDGSFDPSFNANGTGATENIHAVIVLPDNRIVIGGEFLQFNGVNRRQAAVLNADGTLDNSIMPQLDLLMVDDILRQSDGKLFFSGVVPAQNPFVHGAVVRLNTDGTRDTSYTVRTGRIGTGNRVAVQHDGKVLAFGTFDDASGNDRRSLARFNTDGTLDTGFTQTVLNPTGSSFFALAVQADGKILVGGGFGGNNLTRLNSDGTVDLVFTGTPQVRDIKVQPDGKILVAGIEPATSGNYFVRRYNPNGSLDGSFNAFANGVIYRMVLQADGKIVIGGAFGQVDLVNRGSIARLNSDGTLDTTFNPPGGANGAVTTVDVQSTGHVIIGGTFTGVNFTSQRYIARFNPDGSLDTGFTPQLTSPGDSNVLAVKVLPSDRILVAGNFTAVNSIQTGNLVRLVSNGGLDLTFTRPMPEGVVNDIGLQGDGKILVTGEFSKIGGRDAASIVRLLNPAVPARTLFDYDGDGKTDTSVFRPSENKWYILRSSDFGVTQQIFALAGDIPVPADYDGDGKTDIAIFRPSSGDWWSLSSMNGAQVYAHWGSTGDVPRPSDFDGDGRTDYVVFRPSNSTWYRISSANGVSSTKVFGLAGDKPVVGDFDGDGKSDVAIYRPSDGNWWWQSSADNVQRATRWGISTDIPAPADFDGDGKTDFAVYRPSTGVWYIINSSNFSFTIGPFGTPEDKPVPGDYDGDGRADIAVYRPSNGTWNFLETTGGFTGFQFGIASDTPTPNAFVP